jgi:hypothetical protein
MASRRAVIWSVTAGILVIIAAPLLGLAFLATRDIRPRFEDPYERFKYASMGTEGSGLPKRVWEVIPEICPEKLPGGYASLGFIFEPGHDLPIGLPERTLGVPRVGINCALCHTGTVRESPSSPARIVVGMPATTLDFQRYIRFLIECGVDPRFTIDNLMLAMNRKHPMSWFERLLYRYAVLPKTFEGGTVEGRKMSWVLDAPRMGPGRYDVFNSGRVRLGMDPRHATSAIVDFPPLWNQRARRAHHAQWDGNNQSLAERNRIAAIVSGATPDGADAEELDWYDEWVLSVAVPKYPFPIDKDLAGQGQALFRTYCGRCHAPDGSEVGEVSAIDEIGTDRARFDSFTPDLAAALNTIKAKTWSIRSFQKTAGYANMLLDGTWARAPYLHNGSVPNLRALLEQPENRPRVYYRGSDVYDPVNVGFMSSGPEAERVGFRFETTIPGNGNGGHRYGASLSANEKNALIEYLKGL